jgi:hypothetical protein
VLQCNIVNARDLVHTLWTKGAAISALRQANAAEGGNDNGDKHLGRLTDPIGHIVRKGLLQAMANPAHCTMPGGPRQKEKTR